MRYVSVWRLAKATILGLAFALALTGCGSSTTAPVTGKVTFRGQPVQGGTLIFSPIATDQASANAGTFASAEVASDGSYVLQTPPGALGAKIGRHRITYTPPPQELTEEQRSDPRYKAPPPRYVNLVPATTETEVKPGENSIDLELVPGKR